MQTQLRTEPLAVVILALAFTTVGISACTDEPVDLASTEVQTFIGIAPAEPTPTIETPPVATASAAPQAAAGKDSAVMKEQESKDMPMPGQANDHSTLAPNASQKAPAKTAPAAGETSR